MSEGAFALIAVAVISCVGFTWYMIRLNAASRFLSEKIDEDLGMYKKAADIAGGVSRLIDYLTLSTKPIKHRWYDLFQRESR